MIKLIGTVWYFNTTRFFNIFSKDSWHSVIRQQFSKDASLKEKQDKWIMNSSDSLFPRGVWSSAVMKHDLKQLIYTFCWTKIWKVSKLLFGYPFSMISKKVRVQKLQFNVDGCVHRTRRNILDNCWSNLWVWQLVFFDAFVFHGSAICFWTSDRDSSFLCSAPSYMP